MPLYIALYCTLAVLVNTSNPTFFPTQTFLGRLSHSADLLPWVGIRCHLLRSSSQELLCQSLFYFVLASLGEGDMKL